MVTAAASEREVLPRSWVSGVDRVGVIQSAAQSAAKRSAIIIKAEKITSWDHHKLSGSY